MTTEHEKHFEELAQKLGIEKLCALITIPPETIQAMLASGDEHLNSRGLAIWDRMTGATDEKGMIRKHYGDGHPSQPEVFKRKGLSQSDRTCVLKHVALTHYLKPKPAPEPPKPFIPQAPVDYQKQAQDFLDKFGIKFRATLSDSKPAPWGDETLDGAFKATRHHYRVTLSKEADTITGRGGSRFTFDFWGSIADAQKMAEFKRTTPPAMFPAGQPHKMPGYVTAYDVLACISSDAHCPDTFKDFCGEFGYEEDSIKALQQFRRCDRFGKRLREFFTEAEIEALSEIQ